MTGSGLKNRYEIRGDETAIFIYRRDGSILETLVSTRNLKKLLEINCKWHVVKGKNNKLYVISGKTNGLRKIILLHRFLTDAPEDLVVDHINHDTLDNRDENLRLVSTAENMQNRDGLDANNTSGYRGVSWHAATRRWRARVFKGNKEIYISFHKSKNEAANAAREARRRLFPYAVE